MYWFGGWTPRDGRVIGIAFVVDQGGALLGVFAALLIAADFVFAWGFFEAAGERFHAIKLVFLAAMIAFVLTHDLFNMFVWFEVMGVAAFALTAYQLEEAAPEGALTFTVTNGIGSYMMLGGIGLLYLPAGALDFGALESFVRHPPNSPLVAAAFCLLASALLIKGAMVPLHFWPSDAHAVAPSPISVIFSGMLFGTLRLVWTVRRHCGTGATASEAIAGFLDNLAQGGPDRRDFLGDTRERGSVPCVSGWARTGEGLTVHDCGHLPDAPRRHRRDRFAGARPGTLAERRGLCLGWPAIGWLAGGHHGLRCPPFGRSSNRCRTRLGLYAGNGRSKTGRRGGAEGHGADFRRFWAEARHGSRSALRGGTSPAPALADVRSCAVSPSGCAAAGRLDPPIH
jgi:hypothetical protein